MHYQGKETLVSLSRDTCLLGYRYEDYSGDSYRFKDDPQEENYDWGALGIRVLGGLVIVGTVVIGSGIFTAGVAGINTAMVMGTTAFCGSVAVGATAINDRIHGQVSSMSEYVRVAFNGSIIGAMSGATACIPTKGLGIMGKYAAEFCIGAGESAFEQQLWEGEIDFKEAVGYGILNVVLTGVLDNLAGRGKKVVEGGTDIIKTNRIPDNDSTIGHIFRDAEGHIPDTPENRALLENVANNVDNFRGKDKYGNEWYTMDLEDGSQVWVEVRNGNIFEGGINKAPKPWDPDTGLKKP